MILAVFQSFLAVCLGGKHLVRPTFEHGLSPASDPINSSGEQKQMAAESASGSQEEYFLTESRVLRCNLPKS